MKGKLGTPWLWTFSRGAWRTTQGGVEYEVRKRGCRAYADGDYLGHSNTVNKAAALCLRFHRG